MHPLSGQDILCIWEIGLRQNPLDRALNILAAALPERSWEELSRLSIGQRDAFLLCAREGTFGPRLASWAECPACEEKLEFVLDVAEIRIASEGDQTGEVQQITRYGYEVRYRLPNSLDLRAAAVGTDVVMVRDMIIQRCVLQAFHGTVEIATADLPETVIAEMAEQMSVLDAQADVQLNLICPACGHHWQVIFDIGVFFWTEICAQAKRLLREVHTLAQAYGWSESDILSMSSIRRQYYLEMAT
jgi:hypothetical protein